ncbi:ParB family protein [Pectobacterium sp. B2J-2]|uniref:ParB family protein n=1 Tax=Pectobacterium sp. B2J-2 TaxID=3385372 RepID=UPI0038FC25DA
MASKPKVLNMTEALLMRGKSPAQPSQAAVLPVNAMAMVLTLDELSPNPDNPRKSRNPRYDYIKASIRMRGLKSVPMVTRDPDGDDVYIFSDGGNTRYQILRELYQETGDERFYRLHTVFIPWPGRLKCVIGHLAENDARGDLAYIEKAFGVHDARTIYEEQLGRSVTLRELSELLNQEGYPIDSSSINRLEDTLKYLYPHLPTLLNSGLSRTQTLPLLALRSAAEKTWAKYQILVEHESVFENVFGHTCQQFDDPDRYSLEMFRDELIGALLKALPHPSLNYDRWLIELDPKELQRRELFGDPPVPPAVQEPLRQPQKENITQLPPQTEPKGPVIGLRPGTLVGGGTRPEPAADNGAESEPGVKRPDVGGASASSYRVELQPDLYGGQTVVSGEAVNPEGNSFLPSSLMSALSEHSRNTTEDIAISSVSFAAAGLEPVTDIWHIPALQDDIEHLQDMSYRLAFELAESMGCADDISEAKRWDQAGYTTSDTNNNEFVLLLAGLTGEDRELPFNTFGFCLNFLGFPQKAGTPVLHDVHVVKFMRLIRVLRRLRELQRNDVRGGEHVAGS